MYNLNIPLLNMIFMFLGAVAPISLTIRHQAFDTWSFGYLDDNRLSDLTAIENRFEMLKQLNHRGGIIRT